MKLKKPREIKLLLLIVLPLLIAAFGMLLSTSRILDGVSDSVDRQEETRTWQAVQSAISAAKEHLAGTVTDNAHWDDAVRHGYGVINNEWMSGTWGFPTTDVNYDTMYIVDPDGKLIISYHKGKQSEVPPQNYLGDALKKSLEAIPKDGITFNVVSTLAITPDGLAIMAAAPILPTSEEVKLPAPRPNVLIFARSITKEILADMSKQYIVDGLDVVQLGKSEVAANLLHDNWGYPIAKATWQARHPGNAARDSYRFTAIATILALIGALIPISIVHALAMKKMDTDEQAANFAARHDALSGLPNRTFLLERLNEHLNISNASELALIFVDLDGFKAINDAYDHETGDKLICAVAVGLARLVASQGDLARLGGDEFAILVSGDNSIGRSESIAENILTFVQEAFDIDGRIASIGASIGIAGCRDETIEPNELMRRADIAMYDAKDNGRNRWSHYDGMLDARRTEDVSIANELRAFVVRGVFEVAYQPIVDSRSHAIIGVEALARWPKSSPRNFEPERFIPVAEEHGLIDGLSRLILQIACRDIIHFQDLRLAVNLSPLQINCPTLVVDIQRIAGECNFPLSRLEVEFTERLLIKNPSRAKQVILEMQSCGICVALDDFGTGYASVGYLREFAFNKIKLDRSLTQGLTKNIAAQQVVQGTILIAKGLSSEIIAEGIETKEDAQLMRLAGCGQLQGHFFGMPNAAGQLHSFLGDVNFEPLQFPA